jgi:hypothetical protein
MSFNKAEAYQHVLCIDLQVDKLRYAILSKDRKKIVHLKEVEITDYSREGITPLLEDEVLKYDYSGMAVSAGGVRNTLIPVDLFNHSKAEDIFALNYPKPFESIDYTRIAELGIVNVYELPTWIKSMFVIKFPRIKLLHPTTVLLKGVFDQPTFRPIIHIHIEKDGFHLFLTDKSKLVYYNRFDQSSIADMVYHILFVLEQKELEQKDMNIAVYGVPHDWDKLDEVQGFFANKIKISEEKEKSSHFILSKQLLCV